MIWFPFPFNISNIVNSKHFLVFNAFGIIFALYWSLESAACLLPAYWLVMATLSYTAPLHPQARHPMPIIPPCPRNCCCTSSYSKLYLTSYSTSTSSPSASNPNRNPTLTPNLTLIPNPTHALVLSVQPCVCPSHCSALFYRPLCSISTEVKASA